MTDSSQPAKIVANNSIELPEHIAIIMDGNGRWARDRGLPRIAGHQKGVETVRNVISKCAELGIGHLTLFAFSSENWQRPEKEVGLLLDLFLRALEKEVIKLHENNIRFQIIGDIEPFGKEIVDRIKASEEMTKDNKGLVVNIAANYGGRWDIIQACKKIALKIEAGVTGPDQINNNFFREHLSTTDLPDPDLFIRSGGETRISNFLLWQLAYTELFFSDVLWPDFNEKELGLAIESYSNRQRRFGLTGDQVKDSSNV